MTDVKQVLSNWKNSSDPVVGRHLGLERAFCTAQPGNSLGPTNLALTPTLEPGNPETQAKTQLHPETRKPRTRPSYPESLVVARSLGAGSPQEARDRLRRRGVSEGIVHLSIWG